MSGIVGIQCLGKQRAKHDQLDRMIEALAHRGPDGTDIWCDDSVGLGHLMLQTTPESLVEKLPLTKGRLTITADARIDNREELMEAIALPKAHPKALSKAHTTLTDSDLILAAYEKWGERCPEKLLGAFAFAIWDGDKQRLFCARDHFGVKPFYYYYQPGEYFAFASEIKGLLCLPQVPKQLNESRIGDFLSMTLADKRVTSYQHIVRLEPASRMVITSRCEATANSTDSTNSEAIGFEPMASGQPQVYWQLDQQREIRLDSDEAYAEAFREIFTAAVDCRLRSAHPVVSQLSGGLDSSSITCVAEKLITENGGGALHTLSTIFERMKQCDERPFIDAVLAEGNFVAHYIHGDKTSPLTDIETILNVEDEVYLGPSHFYPWIANQKAQELGMRVVLDGFDGDTTVSHGTTRLNELARTRQWPTLIEEAEAIAQRHPITHYQVIAQYGLPHLHTLITQGHWLAFAKTVQLIHRHFKVSRKRIALSYGLKPAWQDLKRTIKQAIRPASKHRGNISNPSGLPANSLINHGFAQSIDLPHRLQAIKAARPIPTTLKQEHWQALTQGVYPFTLEQVDRYAAHFGLEARHPFMDKRLIEFCLAIPADQKLSQGFGRMVMRRAMDGILPKAVQWRPGKADLSPNFDDGLLNRDRATVDEIMTQKLHIIEPYINTEILNGAYQRMLTAPDKVSDSDCITVWKAIILTLFLESRLENRVAKKVEWNPIRASNRPLTKSIQ